eukprot:CAMPEP_0119351042 /NCGR_PEP_ID=MMETSP1334-20130426/316_1 /TAXON_ID=127549 /ORGANISM="Calcidiscus leptoporus, Strain RCC1130" /LENGTH=55 /DNA_ID=CAMNT_0007363749 /DNA_START=186 /DNA_END=349 /DNA_ORIENTATION=-
MHPRMLSVELENASSATTCRDVSRTLCEAPTTPHEIASNEWEIARRHHARLHLTG